VLAGVLLPAPAMAQCDQVVAVGWQGGLICAFDSKSGVGDHGAVVRPGLAFAGESPAVQCTVSAGGSHRLGPRSPLA
jgi:hypothetical protein